MANLNTVAELKDAGNVGRLPWDPRFQSSGALDAHLLVLLTAANAELVERVNPDWYGANVGAARWAEVLKEAERELALAKVLREVAAIASSQDDNPDHPYHGKGRELLSLSKAYEEHAERLIGLTRSTARPGGRVPVALARGTSAHILARFKAVTGDPIS